MMCGRRESWTHASGRTTFRREKGIKYDEARDVEIL
jgi:hypothetical protein